jgi:hypothetical protein
VSRKVVEERVYDGVVEVGGKSSRVWATKSSRRGADG